MACSIFFLRKCSVAGGIPECDYRLDRWDAPQQLIVTRTFRVTEQWAGRAAVSAAFRFGKRKSAEACALRLGNSCQLLVLAVAPLLQRWPPIILLLIVGSVGPP